MCRGAKDHELVTEALDSFCQAMGFQWDHVILRLDRALPSFRTRWWVLAIPLGAPLPRLRDLPLHPGRQQLRALLPEWPRWNFMEEMELALSEKEIRIFGDLENSPTIHILNMCDKAPTLLHSAGHHRVYPANQGDPCHTCEISLFSNWLETLVPAR